MRRVAVWPVVRPVVVAKRVTPISVSVFHEEVIAETECDVPPASNTVASVVNEDGVTLGTDERIFIGGRANERNCVALWQ